MLFRSGGWAVVTGEGTVWSGGVTQASSVQMELHAICEGLARTPAGSRVAIYTDCTSAMGQVRRLRQGHARKQLDPLGQRLTTLLRERSVTITHHPNADRHPSHRAAHKAARQAAQAEGGPPIQSLFKRAQSAPFCVLLKGGAVATLFSYHDLICAAPAIFVEVRRSEVPRLQAIFADSWGELAAYLASIGGIPYCLSAAYLATNGPATAPPAGTPIALAPDFRAGAPGDLDSAMAVVARHGLCIDAIQQQIQLRDQAAGLAALPGWSAMGEFTYAYHFEEPSFKGYATVRLDLAARAVLPGPIFLEIDGTDQAVHLWSLSLRRRITRALREVGLTAGFQGAAIPFVPAREFAAALRSAARQYWHEQASRALHLVDGQEQLRPEVHLWPGPAGAWRWQLPGTEASKPIPAPILRRVLAGYRARLLHLAAHPDLVAASGASKRRVGLQLAQ